MTSTGRRTFLHTSAAAAGAAVLPRQLFAQTTPWATRPAGNPLSLTFVVWQYGKIYEQIARQFEDDWGVKVNQIIEPNVEPQVAKLTTMYAAGDPVDVSQSPIQYLASYIDQGIAQPIDGLPGVDQYVRDFTPFTRAIAQRDGKTWGLPYFSTIWMFMYNDELLARAGNLANVGELPVLPPVKPGDVRRDRAGLGRGHQPLGTEDLTEPADETHHVGRGDGDVEVGEVVLLDLLDQLLPAGLDGAGVEGRHLQVLGAEGDDALGLADAVRQGHRAADHLIRLLRIDPQREDQLDRLIELGRRKRLDRLDRLIDANGSRDRLFSGFLVALGSL